MTGGCSGIGEEIARALAKRGVKVVILDVSPLPERLESGELVQPSHMSSLAFYEEQNADNQSSPTMSSATLPIPTQLMLPQTKSEKSSALPVSSSTTLE